MHPQDFLSLFHGFIFFLLYGSTTAQRRGISRNGNPAVDFDCPEEFGYYPHPSDCTQYYVCVFGGALLESCTGGLMYSHELQTCDWPRNVGCGESGGDGGGTISTVRITDPRTRAPAQQRTPNTQQQSIQVQPLSQTGRTQQREESYRQKPALEDVQQQQQVVYEDELGPAEEIETDRQQRVYRGQPSTLGQVQRDRDGLRPVKNAIHTPNIIPSGPGTVEKVSLVTYGGQRVSQPRQQDQYRLSISPGRHQTSSGQRTHKIPVILIPDKPQPHRNQYLIPSPAYPHFSNNNHQHKAPYRAPTSYSSTNNENFHVVHNFDHTSSYDAKPSVETYSNHDYSPDNSYIKDSYSQIDEGYQNSQNQRYPFKSSTFDEPSESHVVYQHKYVHPISPPHVPYPKKHHVVHIGYENPFEAQSLFSPANNSRPNLDIFKLTKETIQTAFRPLRPSSSSLEKFNPIKHNFQTPSPQSFFKALLETSRPPQEELTILPSTTPKPIFLESSTRETNIRIPYRPPSTTTPKSLFLLEETIDFPADTTLSTFSPTQPPTFEPSSVSKRKRKKTTTTPSPSPSQPPSTRTTNKYEYDVTYSQLIDTDFTTTPIPMTMKILKNDHRFYIPPSTTTIIETISTTTERPSTSYRKKPFRLKPSATTTTPSTPKKLIPEEYYENFKPFPTQATPITTTPTKRQRQRQKPTTTTTVNEDKATTTSGTLTTFNRSTTKNVRVEPADDYHVTTPSTSPSRYNTSSRYQQPTQYDQYYQLYDEPSDPYTNNQYSQQAQPQPQQQQLQAPSSTARSPAQQYRGQSAYKQTVQLEPQRDTYSPDVYSEEPASQDYNDQDEQQYQQLASPKPNRSEEAQENRRRDTLSESSISIPLVTNETIRRSDSFDPAILAPPPRSPSTFLTPPTYQKANFANTLPVIKNKEALLPPRNGGALSKSLNNFDSVLASYFNSVPQTRLNENQKAAPQTILRSEIGRIPHAPIVENKPTNVKQPVYYQELPDKDYQTFFVEIEPKRSKSPSGFYITKPQDTVTEKEPLVEITREEIVDPESQEILYSPRGPVRTEVKTGSQLFSPSPVDVLPDRAPPARFNPLLEEVDYINSKRRLPYSLPTTSSTTTSTTTTTTTTTEPPTTTTSTTPRPPPPFIQDATPYKFIIVSTETPAPFARNPDNEHRSDNRLTFRPEIRARNQFSDSLTQVNTNEQKPTYNPTPSPHIYSEFKEVKENTQRPEIRYTSRYASTSEYPVNQASIESTKPQNWEEDNEEVNPEEINESLELRINVPEITEAPSITGRSKYYSSKEQGEKEYKTPKSRSRTRTYKDSYESTVQPASDERIPYGSHEIRDSRLKNKKSSEESVEVSDEQPKYYYSSEETDDIKPIRQEDAGVFLEPSSTSTSTTTPPSTTKKSVIRIRTTTTEATEIETRKPSRKLVKLHRGEVKNQRVAAPKVKRVRKPSTQAPPQEYDEIRKNTRDNEIHSTLRPIIVGQELDTVKNQTRFRFTVEDDVEFSIMPKNKAELFSSARKESVNDGARVVRPAYEPINLETLDSAEEPIPPRPSTEPSPKITSTSTKAPDHDRAITKPSRGRSSLKPRLRATTASPDSQASVTHSPLRQRGGSSYNHGIGNDISSNRATPAPSRGTRPTLKPSTAIVSKAAEFIDIYRYPPSRPANLYATPIPDKSAAKCRKDVCLLPDCSCGGKEIPAGYNAEEIPQLVLLTFDDSVNDLNKQLYADLFERGRVNPNGCPISATFYVSHEWTDYSQVQNLYANGHEMASHSVSHSFGEQFSQKKWTREIAGQREILSAYGGVKLEDIRGMRAPFLAVGGNKMFKMLHDANFTYDSSMPIYENKPPSWPYTLDYKLFHDCMIPPCPTKSYPGVWEVPMVMWQDLNGGRCSMGDACSNPPTADGVYKMLIKNFERHFTSNRAPFGLFYHAAWFTHEHHKEGFIAFLDTIVNMPEVWLVTNWQAIQWVRDPQPLSTVNNFPAFQCNEEKAKKCNNPKVCNLWHKSGVRYMRTCQPCPDVYPWTGKTGIRNSRVDNEIADD